MEHRRPKAGDVPHEGVSSTTTKSEEEEEDEGNKKRSKTD